LDELRSWLTLAARKSLNHSRDPEPHCLAGAQKYYTMRLAEMEPATTSVSGSSEYSLLLITYFS